MPVAATLLLCSSSFLCDGRDRTSGLPDDVDELLVGQLETLAQHLHLHFVSQIQRIAKIGRPVPVHGSLAMILEWSEGDRGRIAAKRALRRSGRDGDCPAPRKDSVAVKATCAGERRSAGFAKYLAASCQVDCSASAMSCHAAARADRKDGSCLFKPVSPPR